MSQAAEVLPEPTSAQSQLAVVVAPLEPSKAALVRDGFGAMLARVDEWATIAKSLRVTDETQGGKMEAARSIRLEIKRARVDADKKRKSMKESVLLEGKAIDGAYAIFEALVKPLESFLLEQETFAERALKVRQDALRDARRDALLALGCAPAALPAALGELTEGAWDVVLDDAKAAKATREAKVREEEEIRKEAERIAAERRARADEERKKLEAERVAREEAQRVEVERLRLEIEATTVARKQDEARVEAEQRAEREKHQAMLAEQSKACEAQRVELAARNREAVAERDRLAAELREKQVEDDRRKAEADAVALREAKAGERERLETLASNLRRAKLPEMATPRGIDILAKVKARFEKLAADIEQAAATL